MAHTFYTLLVELTSAYKYFSLFRNSCCLSGSCSYNLLLTEFTRVKTQCVTCNTVKKLTRFLVLYVLRKYLL